MSWEPCVKSSEVKVKRAWIFDDHGSSMTVLDLTLEKNQKQAKKIFSYLNHLKLNRIYVDNMNLLEMLG